MPKKKNSRSPVKAVLFDMGKVLIHFDFAPAFQKLAKNGGTTPDRVASFFHDSGIEVLYDGGKISSNQFYQAVAQGVGLRMGYRQFEGVWNGIFKPIPSMTLMLRRLHGKTRLVLVSNTNEMHYRHVVRRYRFLDLFDKHILSFREKVRKPDPQIYKAALKHCRAKPGEVFYIDDRHDLTEAAGDMGFITHTFKNDPDAVERKLVQLEVIQ